MFGIVCYGTRQRVFEYTHTRLNGTPIVYDPFSTIRQSKSVASEWRTKLSSSDIENFTEVCANALKMINYTI